MISSESTLEPLEQLILMIHRSGILRDSPDFWSTSQHVCVTVDVIKQIPSFVINSAMKLWPWNFLSSFCIIYVSMLTIAARPPKKCCATKQDRRDVPRSGALFLQSDDVCGDSWLDTLWWGINPRFRWFYHHCGSEVNVTSDPKTWLALMVLNAQNLEPIKSWFIQGGPLLAINRVITPINGLING